MRIRRATQSRGNKSFGDLSSPVRYEVLVAGRTETLTKSAPPWYGNLKDLPKYCLASRREGATVVERLVYSPPTKAIRVQSPAGPLRIFACGIRAGRCRWSAGLLGDLPFPPPQFRSCSILTSITLISSQDLYFKSRPNLLTHSRREDEARDRYGGQLQAHVAPHRSYAQGVQCFRRDAVLCKTSRECPGQPLRTTSRQNSFVVRQAVSTPRASLHTVQERVTAVGYTPVSIITIPRTSSERAAWQLAVGSERCSAKNRNSVWTQTTIEFEFEFGEALANTSGTLPPKREVIVWGAVSYDPHTPLVAIEGTLTKPCYVQEIKQPCALLFLAQLDNPVFQQDNAWPHTARISLACLRDVNMLPRPARPMTSRPSRTLAYTRLDGNFGQRQLLRIWKVTRARCGRIFLGRTSNYMFKLTGTNINTSPKPAEMHCHSLFNIPGVFRTLGISSAPRSTAVSHGAVLKPPCKQKCKASSSDERAGHGVGPCAHVMFHSRWVKAVHDKESTFEINLRKKSLLLLADIITGALSGIRPLESRRATSFCYSSSHSVWHALYKCLQDIHGDSSPFLLQPCHELSNGFWPRLTSPHPAIQFVPTMLYRVEVRALGGPVQSANIVVGVPLHSSP
ncbi:hypothetical protein PR048_002656 [Dryococelus australis]|uniref:Uncharacterized protein n=1 Tax=Dryococelus australis TaxID=614101 RepID=A0ABQ9IMA3_9NEOP|nr:hypothetical protein PR048_002656 [Dryococelus australis]